MKLIPYREALALSKEDVNLSLLPLRVIRAKKQAELEMAKLDEEMATLEQQVTEECMKKELSFSKILGLLDQFSLQQRKRRQYQEVIVPVVPCCAA